MWNKLFYSFPIQLLILHLRKNILLIGIWVLLAVIALEGFGKVLGIPYLFLDPEYLNEVSWVGFFLVGIGFAIYTMAFHMTVYIMDASKFKFLAILPRPFLQFCVNNGIIPLLFYGVYIFAVIRFQLDNDLENNWLIAQFLLGFIGGTLLTYILLFTYFGFTNKDFFLLFADTLDKKLRKTSIPRANVISRYKDRKKTREKVLTYLDTSLKLREVRQDLFRFEGNQLLRVFDQNHLNLFILQTFLVIFILFLGFFREEKFLQFPAAMSSTLLLAILTMGVGAISFWLRGWATPVAIAFFVVINMASKTPLLNRPHTAFGLDYTIDPKKYNLATVNEILHQDTVQKDRERTLEILNRWRSNFPEGENPKMVMVATSGGGQRAALWTVNVLQHAHKHTNGKLFEQTRLISGASGGMIGAGFFRELYLRSLQDPMLDITDFTYLQQISSDNLNPIIFTLLVNDLLIRNRYFDYNGRKYLQDRGYAFESQLNINTNGILDKPIREYEKPEGEALIPMMPITPLIINDARKLFISPHSMSYMGISMGRADGFREKSQGIDFKRFFAAHDADNLRFISALRMGATFPFITPNIQLPSEPQMEIMDAGLSDNFGVQDAMRFLYVFNDWISENTSGVVLLTIRDSEKFTDIEPKLPPSISQKLVTPLKNIYINWDNVQTLHNEVLYNYMKEILAVEMERVEFEYSTRSYLEEREGYLDKPEELKQEEVEIQRASLNWRLTAREKRSIIESIHSPFNQKSLRRLEEMFGSD
ncbi:patatin-like phospholipase family protein [Litoribacter ruber]|uniref:patatin-like phospholipase family protein n=1 Tax=Litoribacter ruber TaxID=702568 RepID=UPI001BD9704E|nr:patatin-like phospholipase family protein [Litoribacter ruber]MBT0810898.1 patatin-like phospholipase family protein [Litoribacter ruber]